MTLTTTLNRLKSAGACAARYEHLVKALGGVKFDHDAPINLLTILEHNGQDDCLWALCATEQNCDVVARLMACDFAEQVLPIFEAKYPDDKGPRLAIETGRRFARAECSADELAASELAASEAAAWATWATSEAAARAAWAASEAAARAAWAAAARAARAAAKAAARAAWAAARARTDQLEIIKRYLQP